MSYPINPKNHTAGVSMDQRSFGRAGRYYAVNQSEGMKAARRSLSRLERSFEQFLKEHEPGLKGRVERTFKQCYIVLRDYLRNETGLRLTVGDETQAVPVRIDDGLPDAFAKIIASFDARDWSMLLNRHVLQQGLLATKFLQVGFEWINEWGGVEPSSTDYEEVRHVRISLYLLLRRLRRLTFPERIRTVQEDILGAYFFRIPEVRLYWVVIGFMAGVLGVSVEALPLVVAAHELAHAYTHFGRDIDGERWTTESFAVTNLAIAEGLAQFYAKVICKKLETRFPAAWDAYERLLKLQSGPYLVHEDWTEGSEAAGEVVRISMITCRSTNTTKLGRFEVIRRQQAERLGKIQQYAIPKTGEPPGHSGKALDDKKPTLPRPVMDALLWVGRYYYVGGVTDSDDWCKTIQTEMGLDVGPYLNDAWTHITRQPSERDPNCVFCRGRDVASSGTPVQKSANKTNLNSRALLDSVVAELRAIPERLSGDDSPLADPWEEIKSQVQEELSPYWPAYVDSIKLFINAAVEGLSPANLLALSSELKLRAGESSRIREALLRRLIARARKEKIRYAPFDFEYFWYALSGISIYTQIIERTGMRTCWVLAYSGAAPFGEKGEIDIGQIDRITDIHIMTADDFEKARHLNWPDDFSSQEVVISDRHPSSAPTRQVPSRLSATELLSRVQVLRDGNAQWDAILSELNPTGDTDVQQLLIEIRGPDMFAPGLGLGVIEDGCKQALALTPNADALAALREAIRSQEPFVR